ncbi:neo-calmodulin-like [Saccoglossus kowalevskii]
MGDHSRSDTTTSSVRSTFDHYDTDGDGFITISQLKDGLRRRDIDFTEEDVYFFMREADIDRDSRIDFNEFTVYWIGIQRLAAPRRKSAAKNVLFPKKETCPNVNTLRSEFAELDADGNGYITLNELKLALVKKTGTYTDEEVYSMMVEADEDGDGRISFDEFVVMMVKAYWEH